MAFIGLVSLFIIASVAGQKVSGIPTTTTTTTPGPGSSDTIVVDGVDLSSLSDEELDAFLEAEDEKFIGELDIWSGRQELLKKLQGDGRKKRALPALILGRLAFTAGKALFRSAKFLKRSRSAGKLTRQYERKGDFKKAVSDFHRLRPTNVRQFRGKNGLTGLVGKMGKHTVKVRNKSSGRRPSLDIYRSDKGSRKIIRKVRYNRY